MIFPAGTAEFRSGLHATGATRVREWVRRWPVATYVALAWAISWTYWLWMLVRGDVVVPGGTVSHFPGLFGPAIAAFVVTAIVDGRAGIAELIGRMARWRVAPCWYALAALPFLLFLVGVALLALSGGDSPTLNDLGRYSGLPELGLPLVAGLAFVANGFGEEVGWRGFAQERLDRRMSVLRASLLVGLVWAIWHVPSFGVIETYRQMGLGVIPIFVFGLGSGAIVLGWLYAASRSILIVALFHLGLNMGSATIAGRGLPAALVTTGIMIWAALIVVSEIRRGRSARAVDMRSSARRRSRLASLRDTSLAALLRSPLRRLVGSGIMLISYRGRRSGHTITTPVEFVRDGHRLLVLVAQSDQKQWWRNVREDPKVEVCVDGRVERAVATVEIGAAAAEDLARYIAARPRSARLAATIDEVVIVRMEVG
jgi:deazaflavin-dependent oxidoreductase (nitroreductase family)